MSPKERNELLIRMDERLRQMRETQEEILKETKATNGRVRSLEVWKATIIASVKTTGAIYGIIGSIIGIVAGIVSILIFFK